MTIEDAIAIVDTALQHKRLSNIQEQLFRQTWEGKTYSEIAETCGYDASYIRDVGYRLWQMLTKGFGERVTKHNLQVVVRSHAHRFQVSTQGNVQGASVLRNEINQMIANNARNPNISLVNPHISNVSEDDVSHVNMRRCDWGNAIDTSIFYGRTEELETVKNWMITDRCRLLGVFGIGGIGKTAFATKLVEQVQS